MANELIKRYTYAVTHKLPEQQRADIEKELAGLIEDMLADRTAGQPVTGKDVEAVLLELGSPTALAARYRGVQRYLIGPELFPTYLNILKLVFGAVGIAMLVVFSLQTLLNPPLVLEHFLNSLLTFIMGCFQAFAWVTISFGLVEYTGFQKEKIKQETAEDWQPSDLEPLPADESRIPRAEPIAGIVMTILLIALLTFGVKLFGVWIFESGAPATVIAFFTETVFQRYLPFIWAVLAISILNEVAKLITGKWTLLQVGFEGLVAVLNFGLAFFMFSNRAIWNPTFVEQLAQSGIAPVGSELLQTASAVWERATTGLIYLIALGFVVQLISLLVKAWKMQKNTAQRHAVGPTI